MRLEMFANETQPTDCTANRPQDLGGITSYFYLCKVFETHFHTAHVAKSVQWGRNDNNNNNNGYSGSGRFNESGGYNSNYN